MKTIELITKSKSAKKYLEQNPKFKNQLIQELDFFEEIKTIEFGIDQVNKNYFLCWKHQQVDYTLKAKYAKKLIDYLYLNSMLCYQVDYQSPKNNLKYHIYDIEQLTYQVIANDDPINQKIAFSWKLNDKLKFYKYSQMEWFYKLWKQLLLDRYDIRFWYKIVKNSLEAKLKQIVNQIAIMFSVNLKQKQSLQVSVSYKTNENLTINQIDLLTILDDDSEFKNYLKQINPEAILKNIRGYYDEDDQYLENNPEFYQKLITLSNQFNEVKQVWFRKIKQDFFIKLDCLYKKQFVNFQIVEANNSQSLLNAKLWKKMLLLRCTHDDWYEDLDHVYNIEQKQYKFQEHLKNGFMQTFYWKFNQPLEDYPKSQLEKLNQIWHQIVDQWKEKLSTLRSDVYFFIDGQDKIKVQINEKTFNINELDELFGSSMTNIFKNYVNCK